MIVDKDMETFFEVIGLDWRNFSFEELVKNYYLILSLFADEEKEEYYLRIDKLTPFVKTFSKILNKFFSIEKSDSDDLASSLFERIPFLYEKSEEEYDTYDMILGFSLIIIQSFVNEQGENCIVCEGDIFNTMLENYYHVIKFTQSFDDVDVKQKIIEARPS